MSYLDSLDDGRLIGVHVTEEDLVRTVWISVACEVLVEVVTAPNASSVSIAPCLRKEVDSTGLVWALRKAVISLWRRAGLRTWSRAGVDGASVTVPSRKV